jgi:hypothetical protein
MGNSIKSFRILASREERLNGSDLDSNKLDPTSLQNYRVLEVGSEGKCAFKFDVIRGIPCSDRRRPWVQWKLREWNRYSTYLFSSNTFIKAPYLQRSQLSRFLMLSETEVIG